MHTKSTVYVSFNRDGTNRKYLAGVLRVFVNVWSVSIDGRGAPLKGRRRVKVTILKRIGE